MMGENKHIKGHDKRGTSVLTRKLNFLHYAYIMLNVLEIMLA